MEEIYKIKYTTTYVLGFYSFLMTSVNLLQTSTIKVIQVSRSILSLRPQRAFGCSKLETPEVFSEDESQFCKSTLLAMMLRPDRVEGLKHRAITMPRTDFKYCPLCIEMTRAPNQRTERRKSIANTKYSTTDPYYKAHG